VFARTIAIDKKVVNLCFHFHVVARELEKQLAEAKAKEREAKP
jgi:hypothetical protein